MNPGEELESSFAARIRQLVRAAALAGVACVACLACLACDRPSSSSPPATTGSARPAVSLLAVGDTGLPRGALPLLFDGQVAVGRAMQRAHREAPVDAVVLLGDNFYPNGLREDELLPRVVENVARPYCAFVEASAELARRLGGDCDPPSGPIPRLLVALGNHDLKTPGSVELQRDEVPRLVLNWGLPAPSSPAIRELKGGLSLVFLDTEWPWGGEEVDELAAALAATRGPWRVIVGHRPPITGHPKLSKMIERAARQSGRRVHAYLAGHVHGLAAIRGQGTAPALTLIAGTGSEVDLQNAPEYAIDGIDVVAAQLGFLRLDAFAENAVPGEPAHLRISLLAARPSAALAWLGTSEIARYAIALDGTVRRTDSPRDRVGGERSQAAANRGEHQSGDSDAR
ncbi:metallophosphoesterase [Myxococcota bacterium]|nr:metallophosphoesterase [Myxococcota bacterium]